MFFWDVRTLKANIVSTGLTERQNLLNLLTVAVLVVGCYMLYLFFPVRGTWFHVHWAGQMGLDVCGAVYVYSRNGGNAGREFLSRFFALFLVCWIRWIVLLLIPVGIATEVLLPSEELSGSFGPFDLATTAILVAPLYWRIGVHMRAVANASPPTMGSSPSVSPPPLEPLED